MKKLSALIAVLFMFWSGLSRSDEIVVEDAEDGLVTRWIISDITPSGAAVTNVPDTVLGGRVIQLSGSGRLNSFTIGGNNSNSGGLDLSGRPVLSWRMRTSEFFNLYVALETSAGLKYLLYNQLNYDRLRVSGATIHYGLGSTSTSDSWQSIERNLQEDLSQVEPGNTIVAVHGLIVRGSMLIDDIALATETPDPIDDGPIVTLEDAEDGSTGRWAVIDNVPTGAVVSNINDPSASSQVIELSGSGRLNGYRIGGTTLASGGWNISGKDFLQWRMNSDEPFNIYVALETVNGLRFLLYNQQGSDRQRISAATVHHGLGGNSTDGNWITVSRNLALDLASGDPGNSIVAVHGITIRGSLRIDDIQMAEDPFDPVLIQAEPVLDNYELVFFDEFEGPELDPTKWDTGLLWGPYLQINSEEQLYIDTLGMHSELDYSPFELTGSTLKINATKVSASQPVPPRPPVDSPLWKPRPYTEYRYNDPVGNPGDANYNSGFIEDDIDYLSGIITSYGSFKFSHGYVEMRAKLPAGKGLWPAFWTLPTHYVEDVPEIDVMEFLGQDVDRVYHTYHYFDIQDNWRKISTPSYVTLSQDWTDDFHVFGMSWSPEEIVWFVDGIETRRITSRDYTIAGQAMYLLANLAVGGSWPGSPDASTVFPATFEIDYIRAYKKKLSPSLNLAKDYQVMFRDEFLGTELDASKWNTHFLWGPYLPINNEEQYYVDALGSDAGGPSPFSVGNGLLTITAREDGAPGSFPIPQQLPDPNDAIWTEYPQFQQNQNYTPPSYTSGMITSYDEFKFANGYAEIRAKIPKGAGLWPAFWLLNAYYVGPQPEIDVMEVRGENPHQIIHSYHRSNSAGVLVSDSFTTDNGNPEIGYADKFHKFGVRWQPGRIDWYIDRQLVHTYEDEDVGYQLMYVIANLAVGGDFNFSPVDQSKIPARFLIDYIRVYQEKD